MAGLLEVTPTNYAHMYEASPVHEALSVHMHIPSTQIMYTLAHVLSGHHRYQAQAKRVAEHLEHLPLVPQQDNDVGLSLPPRHVESLLVFFCYRGYNHMAGKILRKQVN